MVAFRDRSLTPFYGIHCCADKAQTFVTSTTTCANLHLLQKEDVTGNDAKASFHDEMISRETAQPDVSLGCALVHGIDALASRACMH